MAEKSGQSLQFWDLPTDVLGRILKQISFVDYVHLTQTSSKFREALDNSHLYETVWKAHFSDTLKAYEWPRSEESEMLRGKVQLYHDIKQVERALALVTESIRKYLKFLERTHDRGLYVIFQAKAALQINEIVELVVAKYSVKKEYFIPLIYLTNTRWTEFCEAITTKEGSISIMTMCWAQRLLHLQNVTTAIENMKKKSAESTSNIELCYLDLSRFDFNFHDLCLTRLHTLRRLRKIVRRALPLDKGVLGFESEDAFLKLMTKLSSQLWDALPEHVEAEGANAINVIRDYVGQPHIPVTYRFSVIAKVLQEEMFSKMGIRIKSEKTKTIHLETLFSNKIVMFGEYRLRISGGPNSMIAEKGPYSNAAIELLVTIPLDFGSAILFSKFINIGELQRTDVDEMTHPCFSMNEAKWRAILNFLENLVENVSLDNNEIAFEDGLLYVNSFQGMLKHKQSWTEYIYTGLPNILADDFVPLSDTAITGRIIFHESFNVYGVLARRCKDIKWEDMTVHVYPHDRRVVNVFGPGAEPLDRLSPGGMKWLMQMEGFNHLGMFYFTKLSWNNGKYQFVPGYQRGRYPMT